uniref:Kinesin motor domain-containing protein n=1 Tax=Angiostrongylus cantonensis TaxID=6313 RepID=A0A0K0D8Q2_ANGCA
MLVNNFVNKKVATLNLVDLAGSERQTQSKAVGDRLKEGIKINLSLAVLGRVIRTLSSGYPRDGHVPYRESKLTLILKESLGGNSRTAVIVNVHPDKRYYADTLSSLQFAAACKNIENRVRVNEDFAGETVAAYKNEVACLREELEDLRFIEGKTDLELTSKVSAVEEEVRNWKELVISREKALVKGQLQNDLLYEQLRSEISQEASIQVFLYMC